MLEYPFICRNPSIEVIQLLAFEINPETHITNGDRKHKTLASYLPNKTVLEVNFKFM
jgi:hypothetical protein